MERLFAALTGAIEGAPLAAVLASFVWGVLSIVLSPCHLASIPLIIGFIGEQGDRSERRAFRLSALFAVGILATITVIGVITASLGRMMGDLGPYVNYGVAIVFFVLGLHFLGIFPLPWTGPGVGGTRGKGLVAAFFLGLVFGIGVGPCTFAYMAPMLGVAFKVAATSWLFGLTLLLAYGVGHCSVIVGAGTSAEAVQCYLNWTERSKSSILVRKLCGILVILGGVYLLYTAR
ncbi:MAG: cytochrome c biogenesis protein CcdA [Candidatus Eisenbacteria bacterium]